jgi:hypothetical protein
MGQREPAKGTQLSLTEKGKKGKVKVKEIA